MKNCPFVPIEKGFSRPKEPRDDPPAPRHRTPPLAARRGHPPTQRRACESAHRIGFRILAQISTSPAVAPPFRSPQGSLRSALAAEDPQNRRSEASAFRGSATGTPEDHRRSGNLCRNSGVVATDRALGARPPRLLPPPSVGHRAGGRTAACAQRAAPRRRPSARAADHMRQPHVGPRAQRAAPRRRPRLQALGVGVLD